MNHTDAVIDRLKTEAILAENGNHPILARSFKLAITEIERQRAALAPFARLKVPPNPIGNAAAYSLLFTDIERARNVVVGDEQSV